MADVDIDYFREHDKTESRTDETGEHIPLDPVTPGGGPTWEPDQGEQEMSFGGSQRNRLLRDRVEGLYEKLSQEWQEPQKYFISTCLNSEVGNCTSETRASP